MESIQIAGTYPVPIGKLNTLSGKRVKAVTSQERASRQLHILCSCAGHYTLARICNRETGAYVSARKCTFIWFSREELPALASGLARNDSCTMSSGLAQSLGRRLLYWDWGAEGSGLWR